MYFSDELPVPANLRSNTSELFDYTFNLTSVHLLSLPADPLLPQIQVVDKSSNCDKRCDDQVTLGFVSPKTVTVSVSDWVGPKTYNLVFEIPRQDCGAKFRYKTSVRIEGESSHHKAYL